MAKRGAPAKYKKKMVKLLWEYIDECSNNKSKIPWKEEAAMRLSIHEDTLLEWSKDEKKPEISGALKMLEQLQKLRLKELGISGVKPTMPIFLLKANHGMVETEKRVIANDPNNPVNSNVIFLSDEQRKRILSD